MRRPRLLALASASFLLPAVLSAGSPAASADAPPHGVDHIVVIYEENHSFDNLYGGWGDVNGQHVNGLTDATAAERQQVGQDGTPLSCLAQNDVNLTSPDPLPTTCTDATHQAKQPTAPPAGSTTPGSAPQAVNSHFGNAPFSLEDYLKAADTTCPAPGASAPNGVKKGAGQPGGCTEDLVHRFYQEQWQVNGGQQNRYTAGSDAVGLTMGHYDTSSLPIYQYLHGAGAPNYVVADDFFQGGWGGSFLNHQLLVAAQAPVFAGADRSGVQSGCATGTARCDLHSVVDANGFPTNYPYYAAQGTVKDSQLTEASDANGGCSPSYSGAAATPTAGVLCGDYAVNTIQPFTQPYAPGTAVGKRLPLLRSANIGDELSAKNLSWGWYSGGWDNAAGNNGRDVLHPLGPGWTNGTGSTCSDSNTASNAVYPNCADKNFQFHHQPFGYFANYADGTVGRVEHLKDEQQFLSDAKNGNLPAVSFVKPVGSENEHPGYASESVGSDHLVELLKTIAASPEAASTMVVVTYDEFGGQWDHVAPPGTAANPGVHDAFGPGTRVPALVIDPSLPASGVDHTSHDTTSVLATIEHRFGLAPLTDGKGAQTRDAAVQDLFTAFAVKPKPNPKPSAACYDGGGTYALAISPSYAKISRTGAVTLTARLTQAGRPCQPGLRVGLYARGPRATAFHLSRVLTTDPQGTVSTTYVRPSADFRWYPSYTGRSGAPGLVQVR
ncbi:MAG: acid phosphatase [Mycobacteriales bacterium]